MSISHEKICVRIIGKFELSENEKRIKVMLAHSKKEIWFPVQEVELFGDRLFVSRWLAKKYRIDEIPF